MVKPSTSRNSICWKTPCGGVVEEGNVRNTKVDGCSESFKVDSSAERFASPRAEDVASIKSGWC